MSAQDLDHFRDKRSCPVCHNDKTKNPNLIFRINECGHTICKTCEDLRYRTGSNKCHKCNITLKKHLFRDQEFEDPLVDKEIFIRKWLCTIFNKCKEDFSTMAEFYDYQEKVEDLVYNYTFDNDLAATKLAIENYKKENETSIKSGEKRRKAQLKNDREKIKKIDLNEKHIQLGFEKEDRESYQQKINCMTAAKKSENELADKIASNKSGSTKDVIDRHKEDLKRLKMAEEKTTDGVQKINLDDQNSGKNVNEVEDNSKQSATNTNTTTKPLSSTEAEKIEISRTTFRAFRFVNSEIKLSLPTDKQWVDYKYEDLELQMKGYMKLKTCEDVESNGYSKVFDKGQEKFLNERSLYSLDLNCLIQRQVNDAFNCLQ